MQTNILRKDKIQPIIRNTLNISIQLQLNWKQIIQADDKARNKTKIDR